MRKNLCIVMAACVVLSPSCAATSVEIPPETNKSFLDLAEKKSDVEQLVVLLGKNPATSKKVKDGLQEVYIAAKSKHDAFISGLSLQIESESKDQTALNNKAKETSDAMDAVVKYCKDNKVETRAGWVAIVGLLVDVGIKVWKAYDEIDTKHKNDMKDRLINRLNTMKLTPWNDLMK